MTYRVWRIRNRITGRYLALCRADGSLDYIAFLTKQRAQVYMADNPAYSLQRRPQHRIQLAQRIRQAGFQRHAGQVL